MHPSINIHKADPNMPTATAKPAATVLLVRSINGSIEVFMMLRNKKTNFGGAWVFPGGKLEGSDRKVDIQNYSHGVTDPTASKILGIKTGGLDFWIACIRECFEESGILLAYKPSGKLLGIPNGLEEKVLNRYRQYLNNGEPVLFEMCKELNLKLAVNQLVYLSHWITPKTELKRYSTRFFVGLAPPGQQGVHDGSESVKSLWISPTDALMGGESGELPMLLPTKKNLEAIEGFKTTQELFKQKESEQYEVKPVQPKIKDGKIINLT